MSVQAPDAAEVLVDRADGILTITINRPQARNAINPAVARGIAAAVDELDASDELRIGILTGAGGSFCAGMDLKGFLRGELPSIEGRGFGGLTARPPRKPLIAAVEGYALAGGFELVLACDLVVAADNAQFGVPEVKRGLAATAGGLVRLPRQLPYRIALELALTGAMSTSGLPVLNVAERLGIRPRHADGTMVGGASFLFHLQAAIAALETGLCEVALICYGSNQLTAGGKLASMPDPQPYEAPFRPRYPMSSYALAAARHMHQYGTTREQLADVAVAARLWARRNPHAYARDPLARADVLGARMISDPLTKADSCLVTDGGAALVLVRAERAADLPRPPVYVLGTGVAVSHRQISAMPDLTVTCAVESGRRACEMAGVAPRDMDHVMLYDAFTINTLLFLEDLGFCAKGEAGAFVESGAIAPGGSLPVNTNGGGLSCNHPGMYGLFTVIESVAQLRGECGERQVEGARLSMAHANGGVLSSQATVILGTAETL